MVTQIENDLINYLDRSFKTIFEDMTIDELKCIDWFVNDADQFIDLKNKKTA